MGGIERKRGFSFNASDRLKEGFQLVEVLRVCRLGGGLDRWVQVDFCRVGIHLDAAVQRRSQRCMGRRIGRLFVSGGMPKSTHRFPGSSGDTNGTCSARFMAGNLNKEMRY